MEIWIRRTMKAKFGSRLEKTGDRIRWQEKGYLNRSYKNRSAKADLFLYEMPNE